MPISTASYLLKAAERGHALASFVVAGLYYEGDGFPVNLEKARLWALRAKAFGHPEADQVLATIETKRNSQSKT